MKSEVTINRAWWEYLAPASLVSRRRQIHDVISRFARTTKYGAKWVNVAQNPTGVFRLKPGDTIPELLVVFLGDQPPFLAPFERMRVGHRTVSGAIAYASARALGTDELAIPPQIQVDLVTDPVLIDAAKRGTTVVDETKVTSPSLVFSIPAHLLLSPATYPKKSFVLYQHIFGQGSSYPNDGYFYVGVTTRDWQRRWNEHLRAIKAGSPLLFHRKFREEQQLGRVTYVHHKVMGITEDIEALYASEEFLVEGHWQDQRRLNMIPGGKSGLKYLREHGLLRSGVVPSPDERDRIVSEWLTNHPRKGLPAPWVAEKWQDNDWAVAQICGRDDRLSIEQVRAVRNLALQYSAEEICDRIGARNVTQVRRVIEGKTYARVS